MMCLIIVGVVTNNRPNNYTPVSPEGHHEPIRSLEPEHTFLEVLFEQVLD